LRFVDYPKAGRHFLSQEQNLKQVSDYANAGQLPLAIQVCESIVANNPAHVPALRLLASMQIGSGAFDRVAVTLSQLAELTPSDPNVFFNLGSAYGRLNQLELAISSFRVAIQMSPNQAEFYLALGIALRDLGDSNTAIATFHKAIQIRPDWIAPHSYVGDLLGVLGRYQEAIHHYEIIAKLDPNSPVAYQNLAWAFHFEGRHEDALWAAEHAVHLQPNSETSQVYLGNALYDVGKLNDAIHCYETAIRLNPESAIAHSNLGKTLLRMGDFHRGWVEFDWRWKAEGTAPPESRFPKPVWDGSNPTGKTILLYGEQGFGDQIQFFRYARVVKDLGANVIVQAHPRLLRLLKSGSGFDLLIARTQAPPSFDAQASFMSLPRILSSTIETIPSQPSYLAAEPALVQHWSDKLNRRPGLKIGIAWQGNPGYLGDRFRSLDLSNFENLANMPEIRLINLQVGQAAKHLSLCKFGSRIEDYSDQVDMGDDAFIDTAAIISNLDIVISCDSSVAHLAGALGKPTWILLNQDAEWRWFIDRADSPWYPSVKLFRQNKLSDWKPVLTQVQEELTRIATTTKR